MSDFSIQTVSTPGSDRTWLASNHGTGAGQSGTLDVSTLTSGTHYDATTKVVPSGVAVGLITATGLYAPYDATEAATDGTEVLAGFVLEPLALKRSPSGDTSTKVAFALLAHGVIRPSNLPVTADQAIDQDATTSGSFAFVS